MQQRRVVVTGLGALAPLGNTVSEIWNNLVAGKSGAGPITRLTPPGLKPGLRVSLRDMIH